MLLEAGNMEHLYAVSKQSFFVWYAGTSTKTFCMKLQEDWASYAFRAITMSEAGKPYMAVNLKLKKGRERAALVSWTARTSFRIEIALIPQCDQVRFLKIYDHKNWKIITGEKGENFIPIRQSDHLGNRH